MIDNVHNLKHVYDHVPSSESFKGVHLTLFPNFAFLVFPDTESDIHQYKDSLFKPYAETLKSISWYHRLFI
jgi:hypothetical protein